MRIDQMSVQKNVAPSQGAARQGQKEVADSMRQKAPVEIQKSQDKSTLRTQKEQHMEAEVAAEQRARENEQEVISAIEKANKHIRTYDRRLEFAIHDTTKQIMVKVVDTNDDHVIREIPSEKVLDMVAHLWEMAGILIDESR